MKTFSLLSIWFLSAEIIFPGFSLAGVEEAVTSRDTP
jgi:hypothetical protein